MPDPRNGKMMNEMTEPTGGSKMLPPFGNQGVAPDESQKKDGQQNGNP